VAPDYFLESIWGSLDDRFDVIDNRLVNPKLHAVRDATEEKVSKFREAGKKGAEKRWGKGANGEANDPPNGSHSHSHSHKDDTSVETDSLDPPYDQQSAEVHESLMWKFGFGHLKALSIVEEVSPSMEDLEAWAAAEETLGTRLVRHHMKRYKNPADIPPEKEGTQKQRKTFQQMDEEDYEAKKKEFEKEKETEGDE
jgi:hypothetical protein